MQVYNQKLFWAWRGGEVVELGHFDKDFHKNTRKRGPVGKHFGVLSPVDTLKITFRIENVP